MLSSLWWWARLSPWLLNSQATQTLHMCLRPLRNKDKDQELQFKLKNWIHTKCKNSTSHSKKLRWAWTIILHKLTSKGPTSLWWVIVKASQLVINLKWCHCNLACSNLKWWCSSQWASSLRWWWDSSLGLMDKCSSQWWCANNLWWCSQRILIHMQLNQDHHKWDHSSLNGPAHRLKFRCNLSNHRLRLHLHRCKCQQASRWCHKMPVIKAKTHQLYQIQ